MPPRAGKKRLSLFLSGPGSSRGWALAEVVIAGALSALLFFALLDLSWRVPALSVRARAGFEDASLARSAFLALCRDLRGTRKVLEVSDTLLRLDIGGQEVSWSFSGELLVRSAGGVSRSWRFSEVRFSRKSGGPVEVFLDGPAGPLRTAVMIYEVGS